MQFKLKRGIHSAIDSTMSIILERGTIVEGKRMPTSDYPEKMRYRVNTNTLIEVLVYSWDVEEVQ